MSPCQAQTSNQTQCTRTSIINTKTCWQHQKSHNNRPIQKETPCQKAYKECVKKHPNGPNPALDFFGCNPCSQEGYYLKTSWSHPMARQSHCIDRYTGEKIKGTEWGRSDKPIDCTKYKSERFKRK